MVFFKQFLDTSILKQVYQTTVSICQLILSAPLAIMFILALYSLLFSKFFGVHSACCAIQGLVICKEFLMSPCFNVVSFGVFVFALMPVCCGWVLLYCCIWVDSVCPLFSVTHSLTSKLMNDVTSN